MDLDSVADELYRLRPEEFTAARDARAAAARRDGDRALAVRIAKLRRPSLSAWAANLLVRERPAETQPLLRLGEGLRQAHRGLDGARLRELGRRQYALIDALSQQAGRLAAQAGHPIGEAARREVEDTLHAVLADPAAAREWAAGRLVKPLARTAGFPLAAEGAARRPSAERPAARRDAKADEERRRRLERARQEAEDAERELASRQDEAADAGRQAAEAEARAEGLTARIDELAGELKRLEDEQRRALDAGREARERSEAAGRRVREARRRAGAAAARLERAAADRQGHGG